MSTAEDDLKFILDLLLENSTIQRVQTFLAERGLTRTASAWKELISERVLPALNSGKITEGDLIDLLREGEEYGTQHVFLYQTEKAKQIEDRGRVKKILESRGVEDVLERPRLVNKPNEPTIVDVRSFDDSKDASTLIIKVVQTRQLETIEPVPDEEDRLRIIRTPVRAVHVLRLNPKGLLEMGVESHASRRTQPAGKVRSRSLRPYRYDEDVEVLWDLCGDVFPREDFKEVPLSKAKANLWKQRQQLKDEVRYSDLTARNESGSIQRMATGDLDADLSSDRSASQSVDIFARRAVFERANIYFRKGDPLPSREIHVLLGGRINEFAIPALCSKDDYEYVLGRLIYHNR
jgi:hypothetical protein